MRDTVKHIEGSDSFGTNQVSVASTATQIVAARASRRSLLIVNHGTTDVYIGGSGVTTANGVLLKGTAGTGITIPTNAEVYAIVGSGTQTVSFIEIYI